MDQKVSARFWSKVNVRGDAECWLWTAGRFTTGYGAFGYQGQARHAPRIAFQLFYGQDPGDAVVRHKCDNRLCCNPRHLELGSHADNMHDMAERGRASQGDEHWTRVEPQKVVRGSRVGTSKLTEEQVAEIRRRLAEDGRRGVSARLAEEFGVTRQLIWQIKVGKWWKHVDQKHGPVQAPEHEADVEQLE
jgi:hypothetical protein